MSASIELGTMFVTYQAKTDQLVSAMNTSKTAMSAADAIAQSTGKNIANAFTQAGTAVAGFGAKTVSGVDVAQAKLTLLESKVTEARAKLETLQNAANAGQAVTGIAEAEAQLTLLEHDAQNARVGLQQLQEQEQQTGAAAASMASQEEQAAMATMSLGERISSGANHLLDFGSKLGMAVVGVQGLMQGAQSLGQALLGPAAAAEQVEGSLTVFTGSADKARQEMQALSEAASHSPFKTMDVDQFALKLQSVGVSAQEVIPDFLAIGDSLDAVGRTSSADLGQLTDAFIKIQTEGHLSTGVMGSFAAMGVDAWSVLEKQTGKTHQALASMISHGLYPAKQAMHDLTVGIEANPLFKGQMANDANVFNGALSTLQSNWQQLLAAFGSPIIKGLEPIMANLASAMSSPAFQNFATQTGKWIVDTLALIGQMAGDVARSFISLQPVLSGVSTFFQEFFRVILNDEAFGIFLGSLANIGVTIGHLIGPVLQLAGAFLKAFGIDLSNPKAAVEAIAASIYQFAHDMQELADKSAVVGQKISEFATWMDKGGLSADAFKAALIGVATAITVIKTIGFVTTLMNFISVLPIIISLTWVWVGVLAAAAVEMIIATWPILAIGAGIAIVVAGIVLAIQHWGEIAHWLQGVWGAFSGWFMGLMGGLGQWFVGLWAGTTSSLQGAWSGVVGFFSGVWSGIQGAFGAVGQWFSDRFTEAKNGVQSAWGNTGQWFQDRGKQMGDGIKSGWGHTNNWFQDRMVDLGNASHTSMKAVTDSGKWLYDHNYYVQAVVDLWKKKFEEAKVAIPAAWAATIGFIGEQWNRLAGFASSVWGAVSGFIMGIVGAVGAWLQSAWSASSAFVVAQWQRLAGFASSVWGAISGFIMGVVGAVGAWLQQQWTTITTWINQQWQRLAGWASSTWNSIATTIGTFALKIIVYLQQQWTLGTTWLQQQWNKVVTMAIQLWQAVAKVFSGIWTTYISGPLGSFWKSFTSWWNGIVSQAVGLGSNLIKGVASGISSAAGAVGAAIHSAIGGALANLGFHNIAGFPGYAEGIMDAPAGHFAWVGERGKELMYIPGGGSIFPHAQSMAMTQAPKPLQGNSRPVYSQAQSMALATSSAIHVAATPLQGNSSNSRGTPIIITLDGRQVGKGVMPHIGPEMARELKAVLR